MLCGLKMDGMLWGNDRHLFILRKTDLADWAKQPQKPSYTAKEVGALPENVLIPTKLSELTGDATHRTVTDAEKIIGIKWPKYHLTV